MNDEALGWLIAIVGFCICATFIVWMASTHWIPTILTLIMTSSTQLFAWYQNIYKKEEQNA